MVRVGAAVRDVVRVNRRKRTDHDDEDEQQQEAESDVVPAQSPPRKRPRAPSLDRADVFLGRELGRSVECPFRCRLGSRLAPPCRDLPEKRDAASSGVPVSATYFTQLVLKSQ